MVKYSKFKQWMVANNIKQKDLIVLLNTTKTSISHKLNNYNADFTLEQIRILVLTYNLNFEEFFLRI